MWKHHFMLCHDVSGKGKWRAPRACHANSLMALRTVMMSIIFSIENRLVWWLTQPNCPDLSLFHKRLCQRTTIQWSIWYMFTCVWVYCLAFVFALEHNRPTGKAFIIISRLHAFHELCRHYCVFLQHVDTQTLKQTHTILWWHYSKRFSFLWLPGFV